MANNPYVNKVVVNDNTILDLTADTVDASHLALGYTAHSCSGAPIVGTMSGGGFTTIDIENPSYLFYGGRLLHEAYDNPPLFSFNNVKRGTGMFQGCANQVNLSWCDIYLSSVNNLYLDKMFSGCSRMAVLPNITVGSKRSLGGCEYMFAYCSNLSTLPSDFFTSRFTFDESADVSLEGVFQGCQSLTALPDLSIWNQGRFSSHYRDPELGVYAYAFEDCWMLNAINNIPDISIDNVSQCAQNNFYHTFYHLWHTSSITFAPRSYTWLVSNQAIDLSTVGYQPFTPGAEYSSVYNKVSAIETINSLPTVSGTNNTITFCGNAGQRTAGGAIGTMTAAQIAVATNKGWTVQFV